MTKVYITVMDPEGIRYGSFTKEKVEKWIKEESGNPYGYDVLEVEIDE